MALLVVSIILSIFSSLGVLLCIKNYAKVKRTHVKKSKYALCLLGFLWMFILLFGSFVKVEANCVGIIYDELNGGIQERTYGEGLHKKSIFEHITQISTSNRSSMVTTTGQTNDGQYATFQVSLIYKINKEDAGKFYKATNNEQLPQDSLNSVVKTALQSSTIKYDIFALLSTELETARLDFYNDLSDQLYNTYSVTLINISFDDIDGGTDIEAILQDKAESEQKIKVASLDAQANLITATNQAEIERTLADAKSYSIKVEGEANGDAASAYIEKVGTMIDNLYTEMNGTITYKECANMILSIIFYDNWDGKLPETLTSDELSGMIGSLISKN